RDARHRGRIAISSLWWSGHIATTGFLWVTAGKSVPEAGEDARVALVEPAVFVRGATMARELTLLRLVGLKMWQAGVARLLIHRALLVRWHCLTLLRGGRLIALGGQA